MWAGKSFVQRLKPIFTMFSATSLSKFAVPGSRQTGFVRCRHTKSKHNSSLVLLHVQNAHTVFHFSTEFTVDSLASFERLSSMSDYSFDHSFGMFMNLAWDWASHFLHQIWTAQERQKQFSGLLCRYRHQDQEFGRTCARILQYPLRVKGIWFLRPAHWCL